MTGKRQATIKDIAKGLGLSPSTVSRALKDHPDISPDTKNAVRKLAEELDYQPNSLALGLHRGKSNIIGVVIPQIKHHFFSSVISGIEERAQKSGYNVMICQSNESYEREISNIRTLVSLRVDGILISITKETYNYDHLFNVMKRKIPIVFFDRPPHATLCDRCIIDDYAAAFSAVEHLISLGRKNIIHFAGPDNVRIGADRQRGYVDAMKRYKIYGGDKMIYKCDKFAEAVKTVGEFCKTGDIPDAIFAVNDMTAIGAVMALAKNGVKVPEQTAVAGFTNGLISQVTTPPLTTVDQNGSLIGMKATELLLKRIDTQIFEPFETVIVPTKLIVRGSTVKGAENFSDVFWG
jgi:LacI family transcriptional regulator